MKIRGARAAGLAAAMVLLATLAVPAGAQDEPWRAHSSWATARVGAVKSYDEHAPGGNLGWGVAYRHMLTPRLSVSGSFDHNLIGRFGAASLIEVPLALEFLAHMRWKTPVHPALGLGFAAVYRKAYRSGDDFSEVQPAGFATVTLHAPVSAHTLVGLELRTMSVSSDRLGTNPAFGKNAPSSGRTSIKFSVSRAFW